MSIIYRIALEIPGEHREAPATFTDFDRGAHGLRRPRPAASGHRRAYVRAGEPGQVDRASLHGVRGHGARPGAVHAGRDQGAVRPGTADLKRPAGIHRPACQLRAGQRLARPTGPGFPREDTLEIERRATGGHRPPDARHPPVSSLHRQPRSRAVVGYRHHRMRPGRAGGCRPHALAGPHARSLSRETGPDSSRSCNAHRSREPSSSSSDLNRIPTRPTDRGGPLFFFQEV